MSTTRWIHCNSCYHQLARKERKFYHLSCRHVLCKQCMAKTNRGTTCPLCKKPLERFTELNNQMDRTEKMFYDPGSLKLLETAHQSIIFQHKQRESMIRGILRCRIAIIEMKEMENVLREKIVEAQRRYEKFRTYRRNLQESLRQISPRYASRPLMGHTGRTPLQQLNGNREREEALSNRREDDSASRRHKEQQSSETITFASSSPLTAEFSFGTSSPSERSSCVSVSSFTREQQHAKIHTPQANTGHFMGDGSKVGLIGGNDCRFADDSGISNMQTPASSINFPGSSRMVNSVQRMQQQRQHPYTPSTPARPRPGPSMYRYGQIHRSDTPRH